MIPIIREVLCKLNWQNLLVSRALKRLTWGARGCDDLARRCYTAGLVIAASQLCAAVHAAGPDSRDPLASIIRGSIGSGNRASGTTNTCRSEYGAITARIDNLWKPFPGRVGIAVRKLGCDWLVNRRVNIFFPQQSVSKLWVALTVMDAADRGRLSLADRLKLSRDDLVVFNQPLRSTVLERGGLFISVERLLEHALIHSDNLANDKLLRLVGGPDAVRAMLRRKGLADIRFGPGERLLQSRIAGLEWRPELAIGGNFYTARGRLPFAWRSQALRSYLDDPVDGAKPEAIADALLKLSNGKLLSPENTARMLNILALTRSGPMRLRAGASAGWQVYHKTGTGQILGPLATGYNDVALLRSPGGDVYSVAVMIAETREPIYRRMMLMQGVVRAITLGTGMRARK